MNLQSLVDLRKRITIPEKEFVQITDSSLCIYYNIDGKEKYILLSSQLDTAIWLKHLSFIDGFAELKNGVLLYEKQLLDVCQHGEHVQKVVLNTMTWDEFADRVDYENYFTPDIVKQLAAQIEYNYYIQPVMGVNAIPSLITRYLLTETNRA
jgi:hypothetical protein